jgi:peptidyl-prolyl cis-trans isomerase B (cyclophilin B)
MQSRSSDLFILTGKEEHMLLKRTVAMAALMGLALLVILSGCRQEETKIEVDKKMAEPSGESAPEAVAGKDVAAIQTTLGTIVLEFFEDDAPNHVANFKKLAGEGFYDGIYFHRVIPGFMIQAGCPLTRDDDRSNDGTGGPGYTIDAEFNDRPHKRGTLSMARKPDPNSAGSQFFICHKAQPGLDGQYTVFGRVTDGMDVVDKIANAKRDKRDNPLEKIVIEKVSIETR